MLYGTSAKNLKKLQNLIIQNTLARVVTGVNRREHIQPALKKLHWLPVKERIEYKVALITHKVISSKQPRYLTDIVNIHRPARDLRSASQQHLSGHITKTKAAERSFSCASKIVWNQLPFHLRTEGSTRTFKFKLKTTLFKYAYCM